MKSLLEEDGMSALRKRLIDYKEEPDDTTWDGIVAGLPKRPHRWIKPTMVALFFIFYGSLMWTAGRYYGNEMTSGLRQEKKMSANFENRLAADSCEVTNKDNVIAAINIPTITHQSKKIPSDPLPDSEKVKYMISGQNLTSITTTISDEDNRAVTAGDGSLYGTSADSSLLPIAKDSLQIPGDSLAKTKTDTLAAKQKQKKTQRKKLSWYMMVTPSLTYQKIIPFKSDEVLVTKLNSKGIFAGDRVGFSGDLGVQIDLPYRFTLYSGASYYQQNSSFTYSFQSNDVKEITSSSDQFIYVLSPGTSTQTISYEMRNLGLSVGILYRLQGEKLRHHFGLGVQYQVGMLSQRKNDGYINRGSTYLNYQFSYRMEWEMSMRYHWFVQPNYSRVILSHEHLNVPLKIDPYKAGIGVGIIYYMN